MRTVQFHSEVFRPNSDLHFRRAGDQQPVRQAAEQHQYSASCAKRPCKGTPGDPALDITHEPSVQALGMGSPQQDLHGSSSMPLCPAPDT